MRTAIFIDGANLQNSLDQIGRRLNFQALREYYDNPSIRYYTAILKDEDTGLNSLQRFIDWMRYNGIMVVEKDAKQLTRGDGTQYTKGNMDIEFAVDALVVQNHTINYVFFTGDGDMCYLFRELRRNGAHITLVSTATCDGGIVPKANSVADLLRRECDVFLNMNDIGDSSQSFLQKTNHIHA